VGLHASRCRRPRAPGARPCISLRTRTFIARAQNPAPARPFDRVQRRLCGLDCRESCRISPAATSHLTKPRRGRHGASMCHPSASSATSPSANIFGSLGTLYAFFSRTGPSGTDETARPVMVSATWLFGALAEARGGRERRGRLQGCSSGVPPVVLRCVAWRRRHRGNVWCGGVSRQRGRWHG
jgi:hypothetical protein